MKTRYAIFFWVATAVALCQIVSVACASPPKLEWRALDATPNDQSCKAVLFEQPHAIAIDRVGNIYIANEKGVNALQRISTDGAIKTLIDRQAANIKGRGYVKLSLAVDQMGDLIIGVGGRGTIERLGKDGALTILAGHSGKKAIVDGPADKAQFRSIAAVASGPHREIAVADFRTIRQLTIDGRVVTIAGNQRPKSDYLDGQGTRATFGSPNAIVFDDAGALYVADGGPREDEGRANPFGLIRRVDSNGLVTTLAGDLDASGGHLDGRGVGALLLIPLGITIDSSGVLFFTESGVDKSAIRKMDAEGNVTSLDYHLTMYDEPSDRDGADPIFGELAGIAVGHDRELYVVDSGANKLHQIDSTGFVKTLCAPAASSL